MLSAYFQVLIVLPVIAHKSHLQPLNIAYIWAALKSPLLFNTKTLYTDIFAFNFFFFAIRIVPHTLYYST